MEKRQNVLLNELQVALYKEDSKKELGSKGKKGTEADARTSSAPTGLFSEKHFTMHQKSSDEVISDIPYAETRFDGPGSVLGKPIHGSDDPERAIMATGVPMIGSTTRMSVVLEKEDGVLIDKISVSRIVGKYEELYALKTAQKAPKGEVKGVYFTMEVAPGQFETYQNINQANEVVLVMNSNPETHNLITLSFLAKTSV